MRSRMADIKWSVEPYVVTKMIALPNYPVRYSVEPMDESSTETFWKRRWFAPNELKPYVELKPTSQADIDKSKDMKKEEVNNLKLLAKYDVERLIRTKKEGDMTYYNLKLKKRPKTIYVSSAVMNINPKLQQLKDKFDAENTQYREDRIRGVKLLAKHSKRKGMRYELLNPVDRGNERWYNVRYTGIKPVAVTAYDFHQIYPHKPVK